MRRRSVRPVCDARSPIATSTPSAARLTRINLYNQRGQEALLLALKAVARPGDVIAVESPTYHGLLELIDSLGMLAVEVETCPQDGVMLDALERTLDAHKCAACMFSTTLSQSAGRHDERSKTRRTGSRPGETWHSAD